MIEQLVKENNSLSLTRMNMCISSVMQHMDSRLFFLDFYLAHKQFKKLKETDNSNKIHAISERVFNVDFS